MPTAWQQRVFASRGVPEAKVREKTRPARRRRSSSCLHHSTPRQPPLVLGNPYTRQIRVLPEGVDTVNTFNPGRFTQQHCRKQVQAALAA